MVMQLRVLIVEDHPLVAEGILSVLSRHNDEFRIVGVCVNGSDALSQIETSSIVDAVITDVTMPDMNGIELTYEIKRRWPKLKVLAVSMHADSAFVSGMFRAGASGYILKESFSREVVEALRFIFSGRMYASPKIAHFLDQPALDVDNPFTLLTARERQILQLVAQGLSTKEIAGALRISDKTVETHRSNISDKLDLHNVADLTRFAIRYGLTAP